ncbi:MAG TPA: TonB-dependent receptor, partial [Segetibacter sp.]
MLNCLTTLNTPSQLPKFLQLIFFVIIFLSSIDVQAQKPAGLLKGKIVDSSLQQNIKDATISVLSKEDSAVVAYGISKQDGSFSIDHIPNGNYFYEITFTGYKPVREDFSVTAEKFLIDLNNIYIKRSENVLEDVVVKTAPVVVKGDTTEFNAGSFKTIPNATAEDLLKKLPGVEVDKDGSVKAQGETVTRVLVDGKRFFGKDPKMATRNLPKEMIDKIQIIDALSEESEFNGFDDGERIKTINIITKKDKKKGIFGRGTIGAGDNDRYATGLSANRFNGNQQMAVIAQSNNINRQDFSVEDFLGSLNSGNANGRNRNINAGRGGGSARGTGANNIFSNLGSGITTTSAAGANFNDVLGKKTEVNGSYFFNQVNTINSRDRFRETFVRGDSSLLNYNTLFSETKNINHRINFQLQYNLDSFNTLLVRPNISYQHTDINSEAISTTFRGLTKRLNDAVLTGASANGGINISNSILFRHKFEKRGRSLSINFTQDLNTNERESENLSVITRNARRQDTTDQVSTNDRNGKGLGTVISYTEPLSMSSLLEVNYRYNQSKNEADQQTYRLGDLTRIYDVKVPNLTNLFENSNVSHRVTLSYRKQIDKLWNYSVGLGLQNATLTSSNLTKNTYLQQSFNNLFPTFNLQYKKNRTSNFRFIYRGVTQQPSINQLQDVINNTNVLHIRTGNPALVQEFNNNFNLRYTSFNNSALTNFSVNMSGGFISNAIVNSTFINTSSDSIIVDNYKLVPGAEYNKPVNLNGSYDAATNIEYSFPVKALGGNIHLGSRLNYNRDVYLYNLEKSFIHDYALRGTLRINMNLNDRFDLNFSSQSTYNIVRY